MKSTSLCNVAALLILTFILYSCGAPPTTSQLHLLGASTQRIPLAEAPAGMVRIVIYTIPSRQKSQPPTAEEEQLSTAEMFRLKHKHQCYGSYITKGSVLTAKHCMEFPHTLAMIKLMFSSGDILHLTPPHPTSTSTFTFTPILHPTADLALLIFNAHSLLPPPPTVQLALPPDNDHQRPPLYTEAVIYSSGGTDEHPNYPDDLHSSTGQIRIARGLYVINPHHPKGLNYLCHMDLHPLTKLGFDFVYKCSSKPHKMARYSFLRLLRSFLGYDEDHLDKGNQITKNTEHYTTPPPNYSGRGPVLIVTAHLRVPGISMAAPTPREVLFCPGDSGSAVLNSSGELIGVVLGAHEWSTEHIRHGDTSFSLDTIATNEIKCRHVAIVADLHEHRHWIETTLRSTL